LNGALAAVETWDLKGQRVKGKGFLFFLQSNWMLQYLKYM